MGISLRIAMALVISIVAIIAVIASFIPTYTEGVSSLKSTLVDLRRNYVGRTSEGVENFFSKPYRTMLDVQELFQQGLVNYSDTRQFQKFITTLVWRDPSVVNYVQWESFPTNPETGYQLFIMDTRFRALYGSIFVEANGTHLYGYRWSNTTYTISGNPVITAVLANGYRSPHQFSIAQYPNDKVRWTGIFPGYNSPQNSVYLAVPHPTTGATVGYLAQDLLPTNIATFLISLKLRARARACAVDSLSGIVLGNSWGEDVQILKNYLDLFAPATERMDFKTLSNVSDSTILDVVAQIGESVILNTPAPYATTLGSGRDTTYVDIVEVTGPGLKTRVLLVMPELDFLEEVYKTQTITIIVNVALIVVFVVLGFLVATFLVKPLTVLGQKMELTANLQEDEDEGSSAGTSLFSEIADMQKSYKTMKGQLTKLKAFVPQSVLASLAMSAEDDDDDEDGEEIPGYVDRSRSVLSGSYGRSQLSNSHGSRARSGSMSQQSSSKYTSFDQSTNRSKRTANTNNYGGGGMAGGGALNMSSKVVSKRVTVLVLNLRGFHAFTVQNGEHAMTKCQASVLGFVARLVRDNKGVVDVFQGDHMVCTFNAVANTAAHGKRATMVALQLQREISRANAAASTNNQNGKTEEKSPHRGTMMTAGPGLLPGAFPPGLLGMTAGISSGTAYVGNMGTEEMRRFNIVGAVVPQSMFLERLCKIYGPQTDILVLGHMLQEIELDFVAQIIDLTAAPMPAGPQRRNSEVKAINPSDISSPTTTSSRNLSRIARILGSKEKGENEEWMYELEKGSTNNPFFDSNAGFNALCDGDLAEAKKYLTKALAFESDLESRELGISNLRRLIDSAGEDGSGIVGSDLGLLQQAFC